MITIILNLDVITFVIYIVTFIVEIRVILLSLITILKKYLNDANIFCPKFAIKLLKYNNNNYAI